MDIMLKRIFELKGDAHGSTKELADALSTSGNVITNWKNGTSKSYRGYAEQIAEYYNVSVEWLRGETDEKEKPAAPKGDELSAKFEELFAGLTPDNKIRAVAEMLRLRDTQE